MADVLNTITWATYQVELKEFLGITDTSQDVLLEQLIAVAARACDVYINEPFIEIDPATGIPVGGVDPITGDPIAPVDIVWITDPKYAGIKLGVFTWIRVYLELDALPIGSVIGGVGLKSVKTKDLSETYGSGASGAISTSGIAAAATAYVKKLWKPTRRKIWQ